MAVKPTYEELEQRVKQLEKAESEHKQDEEALRRSKEEKKLDSQYCKRNHRLSRHRPQSDVGQ